MDQRLGMTEPDRQRLRALATSHLGITHISLEEL